MNEEKVAVNSFGRLILDMYRGFPNWQYAGMVEQVIIMQNVRDKMVESGFLIREGYVSNGKESDRYMLGPNALTLVSTWNTEDLTRQIKVLTIAAVVIAGITSLVTIIPRIIALILNSER